MDFIKIKRAGPQVRYPDFIFFMHYLLANALT